MRHRGGSGERPRVADGGGQKVDSAVLRHAMQHWLGLADSLSAQLAAQRCPLAARRAERKLRLKMQ